MRSIRIIDSHTAGEPTRVVLSGGPELGGGSIAGRLEIFRSKQDAFRSAIVGEPRGSDVLVGALLCNPVDPTCCAAVIFFNNVGYLGMCGHGLIGLIATLAHLGRLGPGEHRVETPVGIVIARLNSSGQIAVANVPSFRRAKDVVLDLPGGRKITGDVAWGGNWFFLTGAPGEQLELGNLPALLQLSTEIRAAANAQGFPEIDHVELFGSPQTRNGNSRNFVLCPGGAYDRSPCGTGTSAKLACLAADGALLEGERWIQESILGSIFEGSFHWLDHASGKIVPVITGAAFITAEATLLLNETDPFCWGIRPQ
ncbi:MAG TPA: proline racemase family protein [Chthoniobacteraceae bacterium]